MLLKATQERAAPYAVGSLRRVVTLEPAVHPDRRYRFRIWRIDSILISRMSYNAESDQFENAEPEGIVADAQAGETILLDDHGAEWRAGYWRDKAPAGIESRFVPWAAVLEIRGVTGVVLEYRDPYEEEIARGDRDPDIWPTQDNVAEDWTPVYDETGDALESLAAVVLVAMSEAARVAAGEQETADAEG